MLAFRRRSEDFAAGVLTISRLDDEVIARLNARAKRNGGSMEEEARIAITGLVLGDPLAWDGE